MNSYYLPTRILFGQNALQELHNQDLPFKKALIVTTNGQSVKKYGYLDMLIEELKQAKIKYVLFDRIKGNPTHESVMEGSRICREEGCDVVIGLGGGSPIDAAKAIACMATNDGDLWRYLHSGSGKGRKFKNKPLKIIAVTTTAGTGTECDPWSVITDEKINEKIGWGTQDTFPYIGVTDPNLMLTVPRDFTAFQGFDAFFHLAEGYVHPKASELSRTLSAKGMLLIRDNLPVALNKPNNVKARENMALASMIGGIVETYSSCTFEHTLEHAISSLFHDVIHGAGLIAISNAYFRNLVASKQINKDLLEMARVLDPSAKNAMSFVDWLADFEKTCEVDDIHLTSFGIKPKDLPKITKKAIKLAGGNFDDPIEYTNKDIMNILDESM